MVSSACEGTRMPTAEWTELFQLLERLKRPPGSRQPLPPTLTAAVMAGAVAMVELFLSRGADLNEKTIGSSSPLAAAASSGRLEMLELLLARGADPNVSATGVGFGPLDSAAANGHAAVVRRLLAAGVDPKSPQAEMALSRAAAAGRFETLKVLVDAGVRRDVRNSRGSAADMAAMMWHSEIADYLNGKAIDEDAALARERAEAERRAGIFGLMFDAASASLSGDERQQAIDRICAIVSSGALQGQLDARGPAREPALNIASEAGLVRVVDALLAAGASADVTPKDDFFPLYYAASQGEHEIVEKLVAARADVNRKTRIGITALIQAAEWGDPAIVRTLLSAGADPRPKSKGGATAITNARGPYRDEIVAMLKDAARVLDRADKSKGTRVAADDASVRVTGKRKANAHTRRGVLDFLQHVNQGQPEWTLVAAESDVESVAGVLMELRKGSAWEKNVAARPMEALPQFTFVIRLKGHDWTVAPMTIGWARLEDFQSARQDARELSQRLGVRALAFFGEDTSGSAGYELYERGERVELVEWEGGNPKKIDRAIAALGLYVPACAFDSDGRNARLEIEGIALDDIERADYVGFS